MVVPEALPLLPLSYTVEPEYIEDRDTVLYIDNSKLGVCEYLSFEFKSNSSY